jgi:hypothetical protein
MGKSTISMAIFNSKLLVYQRVQALQLRLTHLLVACRLLRSTEHLMVMSVELAMLACSRLGQPAILLNSSCQIRLAVQC